MYQTCLDVFKIKHAKGLSDTMIILLISTRRHVTFFFMNLKRKVLKTTDFSGLYFFKNYNYNVKTTPLNYNNMRCEEYSKI